MGSDVSVEPFPSIDFPIVEKPTTINLSTIKSLCPGQTVTVVAKVTHVHPSKCVGPNNTKVQNGVIVDPSGTMKLTLWRDFVDKVNHGETYTFKNFNIYKDKLTHEICLSTSLAGSIIEPAPEFTEVLAVSVLASTTTRGEIIGSDKVTSYLSCRKCNKKIDHDNETSYVECTHHCHFKQKQKNSKKHWFAQVMFEYQQDGSHLKLAALTGKNLEISDLTQSVIEVFFNSTIISVTYDRRSKVVESVSSIEQ